jgi:acetylornithine deacetylase/succinyl-diaminopimelate desuccinylase-like protein
MTLTINIDRLLRELQALALLTDCPPTDHASLPEPTQAVTRIVFTPRDLEARAYIKGLAESAGFSLRTDAIGNTFLRFPGSDPSLRAVGTGSHTDAIPHIVATLEHFCTSEFIACKKMASRAYHDSNFIAPIAPIAMLFIPCRAGVSHRPDEYATPESIALGTRILALTLAKLAND